jgi:hypothetical protein
MIKHLRTSADGLNYFPFFYVNDFWMLQENLMPINQSVHQLNLSLTFTNIQLWKFQLYTQFEESFRIQNDVMGVASHETDELKRMFLETNPILLIITLVVSLLHSFFDFLAFKNDIEFWKNRKHLEGLSFRTIILNVSLHLRIYAFRLLSKPLSFYIC